MSMKHKPLSIISKHVQQAVIAIVLGVVATATAYRYGDVDADSAPIVSSDKKAVALVCGPPYCPAHRARDSSGQCTIPC